MTEPAPFRDHPARDGRYWRAQGDQATPRCATCDALSGGSLLVAWLNERWELVWDCPACGEPALMPIDAADLRALSDTIGPWSLVGNMRDAPTRG